MFPVSAPQVIRADRGEREGFPCIERSIDPPEGAPHGETLGSRLGFIIGVGRSPEMVPGASFCALLLA
jgi:hypothetical protein